MFGGLDPANAKDNTIIPGAPGFKPPVQSSALMLP